MHGPRDLAGHTYTGVDANCIETCREAQPDTVRGGKLTICKQVAHHELLTPKQWKHNYSCTHMHTHTQTQILNNSRLQRLGRSETKIKFPWHLGPEADGDRTWQQKHFGTRVIYGQSLLLLYSRQF